MCAIGADGVTASVQQEWEKDARQADLAASWEIWASGQHAPMRYSALSRLIYCLAGQSPFGSFHPASSPQECLRSS